MFTHSKMHVLKTYNADDVLSDVNLQNNNSLNNFLVITKTREHVDVEANQNDVSSSLSRAKS